MSNKLILPGSLKSHRLAAVDLGTNTVRMLVANVRGDGVISPLAEGREMVRLGEGLAATGHLSDAAMDRAAAALADFAMRMEGHGPEAIAAAATSAVREAENGTEFINRVRAETGMVVDVIGGEREAALTARGAASALTGDTGNLMVVDIGGGSTEFVLIKHGETAARVSVPLGVVTATESFLTSDPPGSRELYELDDCIRDHMARVRRELGEVGPVRLVATAGTPTTLVAIDQEMAEYDPARINNHALSLATVEQLSDRLTTVPIAARRKITGLEPGREELIVTGCAILLRVMHDWQFGAVTVSDCGLREGLILDLFDRLEQLAH